MFTGVVLCLSLRHESAWAWSIISGEISEGVPVLLEQGPAALPSQPSLSARLIGSGQRLDGPGALSAQRWSVWLAARGAYLRGERAAPLNMSPARPTGPAAQQQCCPQPAAPASELWLEGRQRPGARLELKPGRRRLIPPAASLKEVHQCRPVQLSAAGPVMWPAVGAIQLVQVQGLR